MRFYLLFILLFSAVLFAAEKSPVGLWKTIDDATGKEKSLVRIWEENGKLYGKIESLFRAPGEDPNPLCDECPSESKGKPIIGLKIVWDLKKDKDSWVGGKIMDPKNGKIYKCKLSLNDDGSILLVRGFIGVSLIGRTQEWLRIN